MREDKFHSLTHVNWFFCYSIAYCIIIPRMEGSSLLIEIPFDLIDYSLCWCSMVSISCNNILISNLCVNDRLISTDCNTKLEYNNDCSEHKSDSVAPRHHLWTFSGHCSGHANIIIPTIACNRYEQVMPWHCWFYEIRFWFLSPNNVCVYYCKGNNNNK